jgi:hypothetical protein
MKTRHIARSHDPERHHSGVERPQLLCGLARDPPGAAAGPSRGRDRAAGADAARGAAPPRLSGHVGPQSGARRTDTGIPRLQYLWRQALA